jgi:glycosyltransferase involved in cell wall biosynthesis
VKISVIIPAYNEAENIGKVLKKLKPYVDAHGFEVIVVNDASTDNTAGVVADFSYVKLINQPYNKGYGTALKAGVRYATNDWVLTMDGDGQHRPEDILNLLKHMDMYDMVVGSREGNFNNSCFRKPGKWILSLVANYLSNMKIPDINSGYRLIRKSCVKEFMHILPSGFSFSTTISLAMIHGGYNVKYVTINALKRSDGKSRVRPLRDGFTTILLITRCISLFNPLKIYAPIAAALLLFSLLFSAYGLIFYSSFPKTAIVTSVSGILVLLFGILSDQVAAIRRQPH